MKRSDPKFRRIYERSALRAAFRSLFWAVITERRKQPNGFKLSDLAKAIATSKHEVSRWFNGDPNWTVNTIANLADALDIDLEIMARDRMTGAVYTPTGVQIVTIAQPAAKAMSVMGFTRSAPVASQFRLTRVPPDTPVSLIDSEDDRSAA